MSELSDRTFDDMRRWAELRIDSAKLSIVEGVGKVAGSAMGLIVCLFLVNVAMIVFAGVFIYLLQLLLHSWVWSAVVVGFVYLLVGVLFVLCPGVFRNVMVRILAPIFFSPKKYDNDEEDCDE